MQNLGIRVYKKYIATVRRPVTCMHEFAGLKLALSRSMWQIKQGISRVCVDPVQYILLITYINKIIFGEDFLQSECCCYIYDTQKVNI